MEWSGSGSSWDFLNQGRLGVEIEGEWRSDSCIIGRTSYMLYSKSVVWCGIGLGLVKSA